MNPTDEFESLKRKFERFARRYEQPDYPTAEHLTYIAAIDGTRIVYLTDDSYSRGWFYPRYSGGKLHEPGASRYLMSVLDTNSVFVDVGAHLGYFSMLAAAKAKQVFAIEALEFLVERIHRNALANHYTNVNTILAAAGEAPGFVPMPKVGGPSNAIGKNPTAGLVPMMRLDDYFTGEHTPTILKIDTEGYEMQVLLGAKEILKKKPYLLIEVHKTMTDFDYTPADLHKFLTSYGYRISQIPHRVDSTRTEHSLKEVRADDMRLINSMIVCH